MNILIVPNSFKECAYSTEIARQIVTSLKNYLPRKILKNVRFSVLSISDGGDGFIEVIKNNLEVKSFWYEVSTPYDDSKISVETLFYENYKSLFIESAKVIGLNLIPGKKRNPLFLSSKGLGELLIKIVHDEKLKKLNLQKVIIGIGGTGTIDLALGALAQLGLKLIDSSGSYLNVVPKNFIKAQYFEGPDFSLPFEIELISDVENPLLGEYGAAKIYGPQKGATKKDIEELEKGFSNILDIYGISYKNRQKLNGAGGGLSAGLQIFLNAKKYSAEWFIENILQIKSENFNPDLIITGEGKYDIQTSYGKGAGIIIKKFSNTTPVFFICGLLEKKIVIPENVSVIALSSYFNTVEESIKNYKTGINLACKEISEYFLFNK